MGTATALSALGLEFEAVLTDRDGVILAESGNPVRGEADRLAEILRDLGREFSRSAENVPIEAFTRDDLLDRVRGGASAGFASAPAEVRAEAIRVAASILRAATDPDSPLGRCREERGLDRLGKTSEGRE